MTEPSDTSSSDTASSSAPPHPPEAPIGGFLAGCLRLAVLLGGALLGQVLAWKHLTHNQVASPGIAVATWFWFGLVYAGLVAAFLMPAALSARAWRRFAKTRRSGVDEERSAWCVGVWAFWTVYLGFGLLYGLTYEQTLIWSPQTWVGMTLYLLMSAMLIALVVALLVRVAGGGIARLARAGAVPLLVAFAVALAIQVATSFLIEAEAPARLNRAAAAVVEVVPPTTDGRGQPAGPTESVEASAPADFTPEDPVFPARHVMLIGLDGLDPVLVQRLVAEGRLPNFERRMSEGVFAPLATLPDANSAVIWGTIYSGRSPRAHGIHDFYRIQMPGLGPGLFPVHRVWFKELAGLLESVGLARRVPIQRADLRRFPVWEIIDRFGVSTGVVDGYLYSNPAIPLDTEESFFLAYGADWFTGELLAGRAAAEGLVDYMRPVDLLPRESLPTESDFDWQSRVAVELMASGKQPRFLNLYAHEPDALQHEAWRGLEPERYPFPPEEGDRQAIEAKHEDFDRFLGELERAADPDTVFVLVSDHGHVATMVHALDSQHRHGPPGVVMIWGTGVKAGAELESPHVVDVVPTLLALLGLPVAQDLEGRVWTEAFSAELLSLAARSIATYEGLWSAPVGSDRDEAARRRELEKLDDMGYI